MHTELTEHEIEQMERGSSLSTHRMREVARVIKEMEATIEAHEADLKTAVFVMERMVCGGPRELNEANEHAMKFLEKHPFPGSYQDQANRSRAAEEVLVKIKDAFNKTDAGSLSSLTRDDDYEDGVIRVMSEE